MLKKALSLDVVTVCIVLTFSSPPPSAPPPLGWGLGGGGGYGGGGVWEVENFVQKLAKLS